MNKHICGITGHRNIINYSDAQKEKLYKRVDFIIDLSIKRLGVGAFLCGMAIGSDLIVAKRIIKYRNENNIDVKIYSVIPCENQDLKWNEKQKKEYKEVLSECEPSDFKYGKYFKGCMFKRNKYIVDNSNFLFSIFDENTHRGGTLQTMKYALENDKSIFMLNPKNMKLQINFPLK